MAESPQQKKPWWMGMVKEWNGRCEDDLRTHVGNFLEITRTSTEPWTQICTVFASRTEDESVRRIMRDEQKSATFQPPSTQEERETFFYHINSLYEGGTVNDSRGPEKEIRELRQNEGESNFECYNRFISLREKHTIASRAFGSGESEEFEGKRGVVALARAFASKELRIKVRKCVTVEEMRDKHIIDRRLIKDYCKPPEKLSNQNWGPKASALEPRPSDQLVYAKVATQRDYGPIRGLLTFTPGRDIERKRCDGCGEVLRVAFEAHKKTCQLFRKGHKTCFLCKFRASARDFKDHYNVCAQSHCKKCDAKGHKVERCPRSTCTICGNWGHTNVNHHWATA
jgi:hypothetical protein